ncbi:hypothetical protein FMM05_09245 [Flavobacterium zepuense]|uniref:Uncharacterized protein n=1 Tax=Flavobacterium zepuense TaxID=2593302 RepID=A0A552V2J1_9FLAO|nr:hypothetical protein [Flavobacterium zepuense]TRW24685.1 hypothetical protein FMM05_09245 [Flavobacterium zepuense]
MTLIDLIDHFKEGGSYEAFCNIQRINSDMEALEIYMPKPFGLNSKLEFFKTDVTAGKSPFNYNGAEFYKLFDFFYFLNITKRTLLNESMTDIDLALRLLDYAEKGA